MINRNDYSTMQFQIGVIAIFVAICLLMGGAWGLLLGGLLMFVCSLLW